MNITLTDSQKCLLTIPPFTDKKGQPTTVDGKPAWATSNEAVASLTVADDGMSATVVAGVPGEATVSVTVDVDRGDGVQEAAGSVDVTVTPGAAVGISIVPGTPEEQ